MVDEQAPVLAPDADEETPYKKGFTVWRGLAIVAVMSMVIFWIWIFSGAPAKDNPDKLKDKAYVASLEKRCTKLQTDLATLPNAADMKSPSHRAEVLDQANVMVEAFIDDLQAGAPTTGDAAISVNGWLKDWRTYLADRQDYAKRLHKDPNAQLLLDRTNIGKGDDKQPPASVDESILTFAQVNEILVCATPGDVG